MKDYNLHYYHLRLPFDASQEEVFAAYREEVENMKTYPAHKLRERQAEHGVRPYHGMRRN